MSRSIKKGPYVHASLQKKIEALNASNDKKSRKNMVSQLHYSSGFSWAILLLFMMDVNMCLYLSLKIW